MATMMKMIVVIMMVLVIVSAENFSPKKVNFIDRAGVNWLFRGNMPKNDSNVFVYDEMVATMRQVAQEQANASLPDTFYLMDLSFLSYEEQDKDIEKNFFAANPTLGNFTDWVIVGDLTGPKSYPEAYVKNRAIHLSSWQIDDLPSRISHLNQILNSPGPNGLPVVIYIHCEAGSDRTGEVSGSYYLTYLNNTFTSFADVIALDDKIAGRAIQVESANALQWYCYYLLYAKNYPVTCTAA